MKIAIVIGVSEYSHQQPLAACANDATSIRDVLEASKQYAEVRCLFGRVTAARAKAEIAEAVSKYKDEPVDEFLFFFSGHGARAEGDFFFVFSDFQFPTKETTGLRNSELDGLIKNISPKLTIKFIDACYSGTQYIKADEDIKPILEKSASNNSLRDLYFLFSSSDVQESWAGAKFSFFTHSILKALKVPSGPLRYRDLMGAIADDLNLQKAPQPTFVIQASNLENFIDLTPEICDLVVKLLSVAELPPGSTKSDTEASESGDDNTPAEQIAPKLLFELAGQMDQSLFCTEKEAEFAILLLTRLLASESWPSEISASFNIDVKSKEPDQIPNSVAIGKWITSQGQDHVFARPTYKTEDYEVEEYRELPKKPSNTDFGRSIAAMMLGGQKEYKLEKITRRKSTLDGFDYTVSAPFPPSIVTFDPKLSSLDSYAFSAVCLFSRKSLHLIYSIEHLARSTWTTFAYPRCKEWKPVSVPLKNLVAIEELTTNVIAEVANFILTDAKSRWGISATNP